jgi:hypothetical protein
MNNTLAPQLATVERLKSELATAEARRRELEGHPFDFTAAEREWMPTRMLQVFPPRRWKPCRRVRRDQPVQAGANAGQP